MTAPPGVEILAIGDELIHGASTDTNSGHIARVLEEHGLPARRFTCVSDEPDELRAAILDCCQRARLVIATGGLGPTADDRTRAAAAAAAGVGLRFDEASWRHIRAMFRQRGVDPPASNRVQAELPEGAEVLQNDWGSAPGFALDIDGARFFALPGVPREMKAMLRERVLPAVLARFGRPGAFAFRLLHVVGLQEAELGERLGNAMASGRNPRVGVTARFGQLTVRIVAWAASAAEAEALCAAEADRLRPLMGEHLVYEGDLDLAGRVGRDLIETGVTLALAESCTGGLVAGQITEVPGISAVFRGGVVAYSNDAKRDLLGVPQDLLDRHGAVSVEVVRAMALGAAERLGARLGAAITGIAGPGGGTAEKPVGTVWFGLAADKEVTSWCRAIPDLGRTFIRHRAAVELLVALHRKVTSGR